MLEVSKISKTFPVRGKDQEAVVAVDDVSFRVELGQMLTLLGPSGCGKTTILRCVAGLESPDSGEIAVGDSVLFSSARNIYVEPYQRKLGMVFQSYAIWPHMTVYENAVMPLTLLPRKLRPSRKDVKARVERILAVVRLDDLARRPATDLSGGQQQRLAIARALVHEPRLLLFDEPLANLDARLRIDLRFELKRLQTEYQVTSVYVTHDQTEALSMSDAVAVMNAGQIEQVGPPDHVYRYPETQFVANFVGTTNFVTAEVESRTGETYTVSAAPGRLAATSRTTFAPRDEVVVSIRPEHITMTEADPGADAGGRWSGTVHTRAFLGESVEHLVTVGDLEVRVRCHPSKTLPPGTDVTLGMPPELCLLVPT